MRIFLIIAIASLSACAKYYALFNYSYLDLLIPGKWGVSFGKNITEDIGWELEYLRSSFGDIWITDDIGSFSETRITLIRRSYFGFKSLNYGLGVAYNHLEANLGNQLLNSVSSDAPSSDVIDARGLGSYISIGNRWEVGKTGYFGVDWITWSQLWFRLREDSDIVDAIEDEDDREDVQDVLGYVYRFPRITLLKIQAGFRF